MKTREVATIIIGVGLLLQAISMWWNEPEPTCNLITQLESGQQIVESVPQTDCDKLKV